MTTFKDRLASSIRIKKKFAPSEERVREARNQLIGAVIVLLGIMVIVVIFHWLES